MPSNFARLLARIVKGERGLDEERSLETALSMVVEELRGKDLDELARNSGAERTEKGLRLKYLGREVLVVPPDFGAFYASDGSSLPARRRLLILRYLNNAKGERPRRKWVDFRQIPSGIFYHPVFVATVERLLLQKFGEGPEKVKEMLLKIGGKEAGLGDISVTVNVLPLIPLTFVFYRGDEEFPPSCKVLFDETISGFYTAEDVRILAEDVVGLLVREVEGEK